jgi:hypothetical protein
MSSSDVLRAVLVALDAFTVVTATGRVIALTGGLEADRSPLSFCEQCHSGATGCQEWSSAVRCAAAPLSPLHLDCAGCAWSGAHRRSRGAVLLGWTLGEVLILGAREARSRVETGYFAMGLLLATFGVVMWLVDHVQPCAVRMTSGNSPN